MIPLTPEALEAIAQREPEIFMPSGDYVLISIEERDALVAMARQWLDVKGFVEAAGEEFLKGPWTKLKLPMEQP